MEVGLTHRGSVQQETLVRRSRRKSTNKSASSLNSDRSNDDSRVRAVSATVDSRIFPRGATTTGDDKVKHAERLAFGCPRIGGLGTRSFVNEKRQ